MKQYALMLAGAVLLAACEQKTETVAPEASPTSTPEATNTAEPVSSPAEGAPANTPAPPSSAPKEAATNTPVPLSSVEAELANTPAQTPNITTMPTDINAGWISPTPTP